MIRVFGPRCWRWWNLTSGVEGLSLQAGAKTIEGKQHPDRDAQFRYINERARQHMGAGQPVISVDTKKKELVGDYKNANHQCRLAGEPCSAGVRFLPGPKAGEESEEPGEVANTTGPCSGQSLAGVPAHSRQL
ncbi:hypothetical protein GCM10022206_62250 [Streptomyces chiangmaiensis]